MEALLVPYASFPHHLVQFTHLSYKSKFGIPVASVIHDLKTNIVSAAAPVIATLYEEPTKNQMPESQSKDVSVEVRALYRKGDWRKLWNV